MTIYYPDANAAPSTGEAGRLAALAPRHRPQTRRQSSGNVHLFSWLKEKCSFMFLVQKTMPIFSSYTRCTPDRRSRTTGGARTASSTGDSSPTAGRAMQDLCQEDRWTLSFVQKNRWTLYFVPKKTDGDCILYQANRSMLSFVLGK